VHGVAVADQLHPSCVAHVASLSWPQVVIVPEQTPAEGVQPWLEQFVPES
jgi:hypothetical protein